MLNWQLLYMERRELDRRWLEGEPEVRRLEGHTDRSATRIYIYTQLLINLLIYAACTASSLTRHGSLPARETGPSRYGLWRLVACLGHSSVIPGASCA